MRYQFVREPLTEEEADRLSHACSTIREKLIVWTLLDTGLRISELCNLTAQSILWQRGAMEINGKGGPYGKMSKKRVVPMSPRIKALLEPYFAIHDKWFLGPRQVQNIVKEIANRARISRLVSPHILRHTFATLNLQNGISIASIQKALGHDHLATTAIYLNLTDAHMLDEFQRKR